MEVTVDWVCFFNAAKPSPPDTLAQMNIQIQPKQSSCYADAVSRQNHQTSPKQQFRRCSISHVSPAAQPSVFLLPNISIHPYFRGVPPPFSTPYVRRSCSHLTPFHKWACEELGLAHPSSNPPLKFSGLA